MPGPYALLADIGGTNARFALCGTDGVPFAEHTLPTADYDGPVAAAEAYLQQANADSRPYRAAFAVACPVLGDAITLTNNPWAFSVSAAEAALGVEKLTVVNDFVGQALAVLTLEPDALVDIGEGTCRDGFPVAVLGPGTGLGQALLVPGGHGRWKGIATEGGHATMAPADDLESAVLGVLRGQYGHVSAERVISGMGLVNLYEAHCTVAGQPRAQLSPSDVTDHALAGSNAQCVAALDTFFSLLGTTAGNMALMTGALGGVYLAGGILPRMVDALQQSSFRSRFTAKGRFADYNAGIATKLVVHANPAFRGLASLVR